MTEAPEREPVLARGRTLFTWIYGGPLTAAYATQKQPWRLAGIVASAAVVLWVAHLYAHGLSESIVKNRRLTRDELGALFGRELGILLAAAAPTAALVLGALGVFHETTAIWIALGVGLVTLAAEGIRFARLERLGPMGTVVAMAINLALGLVVVALKVLVAH